MIFLDSDVAIELLRGKPSAHEWLVSLGNEELVISEFVALELLQGCANKFDQAKVEKLIARFRIEWATSQAYKNALNTINNFTLAIILA
jgi:predicted nucleic acid-binding protein